jgi:hypothetical protein
MGASQSNSYLKYTNDFELVVRATKDLEYLLEKEFGAPNGREKGLYDKVWSHLVIVFSFSPFCDCLALSSCSGLSCRFHTWKELLDFPLAPSKK